jgi:hypothetical protein
MMIDELNLKVANYLTDTNDINGQFCSIKQLSKYVKRSRQIFCEVKDTLDDIENMSEIIHAIKKYRFRIFEGIE